MKRISLLWLTGLAAALLTGCNSSNNLGVNTNNPVPAALQAVVTADETADPDAAGVNADDELADSESGSLLAVGPQAVIPDSVRIEWRRHVTSSSFVLTKAGTEDSMMVTAQRNNTGLFNGRLHRRMHADSLLYQKPYAVTWSRQAIYKKIVGLDGEEDTQWMLKSLTLAQASQTSPDGLKPTILSVQLSGHDRLGNPTSITFTDPTEMYDPNSIPEFAIGDSVLVKVTTDGSDSNQRGYIHFDFNAGDRGRTWRRPLAYNGSDGAFEGSFRVREGFGKRHHRLIRPRSAVWVDVLTKESIYDTDVSKYGATGWGLPFRLFRPMGAVAVNQ